MPAKQGNAGQEPGLDGNATLLATTIAVSFSLPENYTDATILPVPSVQVLLARSRGCLCGAIPGQYEKNFPRHTTVED